MYASYFGLSKRLFRGSPQGSDVFVGPQTASVMTTLKKALAVDDAVITVSGPVGVGKTTIVRRALDNIGTNRIVITVGRMHLGYDEVIELLLAGLGARQLPKSMVHRFAMFRRLLQQYSDKGTRIFIVVEDATRIGLDALSELEALTAEDSGASSGASLVLMGTEGAAELLRAPELVRLKQRVRLRQVVKPLAAGELQGYLKHCFRLAGGDFDAVFVAGCGDILHRLSDGIPRLANNIVEQALNTAAEHDLRTLSASFVERVAAEEIGLTAEHGTAEIQDALKQSADTASSLAAGGTKLPQYPEQAGAADADTPAVAEEAEDQANILPPAASDLVAAEPVGPVAAAEPSADTGTTADAASAADSEPASDAALTADDDIPDLIQDTLPALEALAPETGAADAAKTELESLFADEDGDLPTLFSSQRLESPVIATSDRQAKPAAAETIDAVVAPESPTRANGRDEPGDGEIPAWERDPTLAELRPDLEALERAMTVAQAPDEEPEPVKAVARAKENIPELVPEITLDREIQAKIDEATEALKQTEVDLETAQLEGEDQSLEASLTPSEKVDPIKRPTDKATVTAETETAPPAPPAGNAGESGIPGHLKDTGELKRVASGLAQARSLEDVDDKMAETLFGEEFSMAAAEVAASVASSKPANDALQLVDDASSAASPRPNGTGGETNGHAVPQASKPPAPDKAGLDPRASERLATVRALNNGAGPAAAPPSLSSGETIVMADGTSSGKPRKPEDMPLSIEDQINSATQTLRTLKISPSALADNDDDDRPKGGFFSRFRRP